MKLTAQEVIKMKSVNIGAVSADMLPDVGGMAFDTARAANSGCPLSSIKPPIPIASAWAAWG